MVEDGEARKRKPSHRLHKTLLLPRLPFLRHHKEVCQRHSSLCCSLSGLYNHHPTLLHSQQRNHSRKARGQRDKTTRRQLHKKNRKHMQKLGALYHKTRLVVQVWETRNPIFLTVKIFNSKHRHWVAIYCYNVCVCALFAIPAFMHDILNFS